MIESEALAFAFYSGHLTEFQRFPTTKFAANPRLLGVVVFFHLEDPGILGCLYGPISSKNLETPNFPSGTKKKDAKEASNENGKVGIARTEPNRVSAAWVEMAGLVNLPSQPNVPSPQEMASLTVDG